MGRKLRPLSWNEHVSEAVTRKRVSARRTGVAEVASAQAADTRRNSEEEGASVAVIPAEDTSVEGTAAGDISAADIRAATAGAQSTIARWAAAPKGAT